MQNNKKYPLALSALKTNQITLLNRIVFPAFQVNYANPDGTVSDKLIRFYSDMAKGGCGLIFTGSAAISKKSIAAERMMHIHSDDFIPGLKKVFSAILQYDSVPAIQISHFGRQGQRAKTGYDLLAPSAIPCPVMSTLDPTYRVREATLEDIEEVEQDFLDAAIRATEAGAKVIEVLAAHGYLLNGFLSPYSNKRTDNYGGTPENRARIVCEIIKKIKGTLKDQVAISVRISGHEFLEDGLVPEDFKEIIPLFEKAGMDLLNISIGTVETLRELIPDHTFGEAPFTDIAATIKSFTTVPVCTVGGISSLETAEKILSNKQADLVAIGRAQIADPFLVKKSIEGKEITKCLRCNKCLYWDYGEPELRCVVNKCIVS